MFNNDRNVFSGEPANLGHEKVKLHYVVHYLHRGSFDAWVPPAETDEEKAKVEMYICKLCNRKFRNNLNKKEYPGEDKEMDLFPARGKGLKPPPPLGNGNKGSFYT